MDLWNDGPSKEQSIKNNYSIFPQSGGRNRIKLEKNLLQIHLCEEI